jgi:uncharacterized protein YkwD
MRTAMTMAAVLLLAIPAAPGVARTASKRAESHMMSAINWVRAQHGLPALQRSDSLIGSAERYSNWLMANDVFAHQGSIQASSQFAVVGEALAWHSGHRFGVQQTIRQWLASPTHRSILLSSVMRRQGAGVKRGLFGSSRATIWVLHVGRIHAVGSSLPSLPSL